MKILLVGLGAIGQEILRQLDGDPVNCVTAAVVRTEQLFRLEGLALSRRIQLVQSTKELGELPDFVLECAGGGAIASHVIPLLRRGVSAGVCSAGALVDDDVAAAVREAAVAGGAQVHVLSGAVGGIDALSAAKLLGLDSVRLTSSKPPAGWKGTAAEQAWDLPALTEPVVIFRGSARVASGLYPKNANSAATVALAGIGADKTEVILVADPKLTNNTHEIHACGGFGELRFSTSNQPLTANPKTSALTVLSALRTIRNQTAALIL